MSSLPPSPRGERLSPWQAAARLAAPAGLALLAAASAAWAVLDPETWYRSTPVVALVGAGALLILISAVFAGRWLAGALFHRRAAAGLNAAFAAVLALAILIFVNVISSRQQFVSYWTSQEVFALSPNTLSTLEQLDKSGQGLRIAALLGSDRFSDRVRGLLAEYGRRSKNLKIDNIDFYRDKTRVDLEAKNLRDPVKAESLVLRFGAREKVVEAKALVHFDRGAIASGRPPRPRFQGEAVITSAIRELIEPRKLKACFLQGHGEFETTDFGPRGLSDMAKRLQRDGFETATLNLEQARSVPDDCTVLVCVAPIRSFGQNEVDAVARYLKEQGGRLLVMALPQAAAGGLTGLREFLFDEYKISVRDDLLVAQPQALSGDAGDPRIRVAQWGDHPVTRELKGFTALFPWSCPVVDSRPRRNRRDPAPDIEITTLATSSSQVWGETSLNIRSEADIRRNAHDPIGPFTLAVAAVRKPARPTQPAERLIVMGNALSATNQVMSDDALAAQFVNRALVTGAVNWLAGREYNVGLEPLRLAERPLEIGAAGRRFIRFACWAGLPGALVVLAALILWRRTR
ncbi:MAG TPA: GldG family protein [Candidatus Brocadiia bacterium]|nr:GldG family protein [Candidatus Brocadiia bacterium]